MNSSQKIELYLKKNNKLNHEHYLNKRFEFIKSISNQKMNNECFDCRKTEPKYISINNAIFLCEDCAQIHETFPKNISFVAYNNLNLLSDNVLKYLYFGGNENLDNFINYDFPGLQNYSAEILYKTQAMIYYREQLKCKIEGKPKPVRPNDIMAYKLVSENGLINIREEKSFKNKNIILNKDVINNYYNNFNNTFNTYNNYNCTNEVDYIYKRNTLNSYNKNNEIKYCSLVSKTFFDEMNNLFGKISSEKYKNISNNNYKKITILKSLDKASKIKNKFQNNSLKKGINRTLNISNNYSITNRTNESNIRRSLNRSTISEDKSPSHINYSQKYIKPKILNSKYMKNKEKLLNINFKENDKLKNKRTTINLSNIKENKDTLNLLNLNDKLYNKKKRVYNSCNIYKKPLNSDYNLNFEINEYNNFLNSNLLNEIHKYKKKYVKNDYINYINNINHINNKINFKKNIISNKLKNKTNDSTINNANLNSIESKDSINSKINNNRERDKIKVKKNNFLNISYDRLKRKPIKVNLNKNSIKKYINSDYNRIDIERKQKALQDKKEQEQIEEKDLHNLLFERKDNYLFDNIIYMNNV